MKLHLPKSLRTALLSCLAAISPWSLTLATGAISVGAVAFVLASSDALAATTTYSSSTETYNGETYAGHVFTLDLSYSGWDGDGGDGSYTTTWDACNVRFANRADTKLMYYTYSTNEAGEEVKTENYVSTNATGGPDNQKIWYSFLGTNTLYSTKAGNTLRLTGATQNTVIGFDYEPISLGGLIVDACLGGHTYKLMGASGTGGATARDMELKAGEGLYANMTIGANTSIELGSDTFTVASSGAWNVADDINLIINAGTAQLQAGVLVTLKGLGNLDLGATALKMADGASMVVAAGSTLELGANASGSTGAITNNGSVYLENRGSTFALTNNATGTVYLTGANSVATLNNAGTLSFADGSTLTLGSMANDFYGGKTYTVGNLALTSGGAVSNWAPYFGYTDGTEMTYQDGQLTVTVDGSGYYWNGTADSYSWSAANALKGGNAATIAAGGRLYLTDSAAYKTVHMDTTMALGSVYLYSNDYTLHVTADNTIPANFVVSDSSYSLTKTGAATLSMTSEQVAKLAGIAVNEGSLKITGTITGDTSNGDNGISSLTIDKDFTGITGAGTLAVTLTGGSTYGSNNRSTIKLDSGFTGTLEVLGGSLDRLSTLGNATVKLNNGGLFGRETPSGGPTQDFANNLIIEGNSWLIGQGTGGKGDTYAVHLTGSVSGSGTLAFTGECDWYFKGDMSGFDGSVALSNHYDYIVFEKSVNVKDLTFGTRHDNNSRLVMGNGTAAMTFGITNAMTVGNVATFDIQNNATVVNTGLLTVNANFNVTGDGAYEMNGGLVINSGKTLTLNVAEASIASITNNGTLTLGANLTSLTLGDFVVGTDYEIGMVTDGAGKDWYGLLGLSQGDYTIVYENGVLKTAVLNPIVWSSPADDDITWGGANNWSQNGNNVELTGADVLVLDVRADNSAVSNRIQFTDNATAESVTVKDDYTFVVEEGGDYSLDASVALTGDGAIAKDGAGKLTINSGLTTNALTVSAGTLVVDDVTLASGNTFTKNGSGNLELGTVNGATKLTLNGGDTELTAWSVASGTTVTKVGTGTLTISGDASALKGNLDVKEGDVTFLTDAAIGNLTIREIFVNIGDDNTHVNVSFANSTFSGFSGKVKVAAGSTLTGESVIVNNSTYRLSGGGVYNVDRLVFATSHEGNMNVGSGLTVNVTGTTTSADAGTGSFVMGGAKSTITVDGTLSLASGVSATGGGAHTFDVGNGGTLWLKDGLQATLATNVTTVATINVNSGATMIVDGSKTDNTTAYTVALKDGSSVFTTQGATVLNAMGYTGSVKLGAAAGTTLSLTAENPSVGALTILGTADTVKGVAGGGTVSYTGALSGTSVTLNEGAKFEATAGLNLTGALTLGAHAEATLGGVVALSSLSNAGSINVAAITGLSLGDISMQAGATYNVGELVGYENLDWGSLLGAQDYLSVSYDAGRKMLVFTGNAEHPILWVGTEGETWDSTAADGTDTQTWSLDGAPIALQDGMPVVLGNAASLGELNDTVTRTIVLDADTVVGSVTVQDAYRFSVAEGETYSFDANSIVLDGGSLSKEGAGTLSMSLEDAVAAKLNIAAGTLNLSDVLTDSESGSRVNLTALRGAGTLSITAAGTSGVTGNGTGQRTSIDLADSFTGTLAVVGGNLDMASTIGGAGSVLLDGATLVGTGSVVQNLGWNIAVSDKGAYLRRFGYEEQDNRTEYATRLTGTLTGSAAAMLRVIDSGEWFLAGDMSGYHGGLSIEGDTNYVTFESSATLASLSAVGDSHILVDNGASLDTATTAVSDTVTTGATEGATLNLGAVTVNENGTLKIEGAGAHTLSTLAMGNNSTLELAAGTNAGITKSAPHAIGNGNAVSIKLGEGATLTDAGSWQLTGSTMTVQGGGEYKLNSLVLSANQAGKTTVNVESGTILHITGTATNNSKQEASFGLGHWNADNAVNVRGVLELECGISSYSGYSNTATITVENGGKIAFNNGLHAAGKDNAGVINIKGGGVLEVSGTNVTGTNLVTVIVENEAKIFGGTANGATESVIANDMVIKHGFYVGAAAGTTLTLAPESGSFNFENASSWVDVLGTDSGHGGKVVFDVDTLQLNALKVYSGAQAAITSDARLYLNQHGGIVVNQGGTLTFDGAGEITLGQAIKNAGTVEILNAADTQFVLNNALLEEEVGVSKTWTLVNNTGMEGLTGTITGWDALGLGNFLLDGSALQQGDWDGVRIEDGKVMLYMLTRYWDATGDDGVWNTGADANWRESADSTETVTFETNSRVTFTDTDETRAALDKSVTVADGGVHAKSVTITGSDYVFRGGKVLVNQSLSAQQNARFDSAVVIGSSAPLQLDVEAGATLTLSTLETVSTQSYGGVSYGSGAFSKTGAGTLLITDAINGTITGATVSGGKLVLGVAGAEDVAKTVSLAVGSNTLTTAGGSLENVELLSSGTVKDYTGATAQANNVIKSAVGENYAMLTGVALQAGAATGYASLQKVAFAGNSTLSGYITYESTKQQRQMAVATGGTLTVSNLTFDLHGLSAGTKVLIENKYAPGAAEGFKGELLGWTTDNVTLLYSGIAVNSAAVNMNTAGVVELLTEDKEASRLYWDGLVAGAASSAWDKSSANWSTTAAGTDGIAAFLALSNTYFGATPEGGSKKVNAAQDMVMSNMFVTEGGYSFTGSRLATLGNMYITPEIGDVSFANDLVAQGNVSLGGNVTLTGALQAGGTITATGAGALSFGNAVSAAGNIELNASSVAVNGAMGSAGDVSISSGTTNPGGAGSLTVGSNGSISGANVNICVNSGAASDTHYRDYVVESAGNITATAEGGKVSFTGNGAAHITGTVTADEIVVDTQSSNGIIFRQLDTDTLTITEGSYAALTDETSTGQQETSRIGTIQLGGRLGLTQFAGTYSGYNLVTTSATATVDFATIAKVTFASVKGEQLADGTYGSIVFNDSYRELTVNKLETVNNITFGAGEYWAKLNNASGAIHGNLTVRGGGGLYVSSDDIMANGSGKWYISGPLYLQGTTQTLAGNAVYLDGAVISGTHASGMNYTADSQIHYTGNNTISANMTVADGKVLTIEAGNVPEDIQAEQADILTLNGNLNGNGDVLLTGSGRVSLGAANAFTGSMTVQNHTQLSLDNTQALASANLVLNPNGVLIVDRSAVETPFTIGALTLGGGALQINNLMAMDAVSAKDAALKLGALNTRMTNTLDLTLSFTSGELQTMKTYNLFTADASYSLADIANLLNLELSVVNGTETLPIADNQYKLVYDADSNVIAIRTMLGNIWDGGADGNGDGTWAVGNEDANWSGKNYDERTAFNDAIFADLTGEGIGENAVVTIQGTVNPGDVYFEADTTDYVLNATDTGAMLGAGNVIHKAGAADVTLNLANNGTVETALGGMDLQAGNTTLAANVAVAGEVSVAAGATLQTGANTLLMVGGNGEAYTAQGTYSGLTMDATGIAGVADALGVVTNGIIDGAAELNYLNLTGTGKLTNVTIGSGVNVAAGSAYTLNGHITFLDTLQNAGTVNFAEGVTVELGALSSNLSEDGTSYIYQLVQGDGAIKGLASGTTEQDSGITASDVFINGVNLSAGLADGIATVLSSDNGTVSISIGKELEGGGVDGSITAPVWDARWGKDGKAPALAKRFGGATNMFFNTDTGYLYTHIVSAGNAAAVNAGNALVVSIDAGATAPVVAAGNSSTYSDHEVWIYDHSAVDTVVGGRYYASTTEPTGSYNQNADTHLYINTADAALADQKTWVVGGSWNAAHSKDSYVTVQNGNILTLVGGSYGANQDGSTHVYVDGGTIAEVFAGGFNGDVASSNLTITGGTLGLTAEAVNKRVYGGSYYGTVHGDVNVTVEGDATITKLVGGGYHGAVEGDITINLLSGTVTERVDAAGVGDSSVTGDVLVNLTQGFNVTGGLYGGKQSQSGVTLNGSSTLAFVSAGETYDLSAIAVQGFDTFTLADGTHVKVSTQSGFATDTASGVLTISGLGKVELVGNTDLGRDIMLTDGATLWFNSDYAGNAIGTQDSRRVLTATAGTTIEITGQPTNGDGLCVWLDLTGHGVDGKGALYKGLVGAETTPSGKVALPKVTLSDSASVNAEDNIYFIDYANNESELILKGNTLTKVGSADLVLYNSTVTDTSANDTDAGVDGTIFVKEGTLGTGHGMRAAKTNIVLSSGSLLDITSAGTAATNIGALSGSGSVALSNGLVINTSSAGSYGKGSDWMTEGADAYSQFSADSGFAYGVYSGTISGANSLSVKGDAVQYLSGSDSTFTGGVHMYDSATLYLMSGTSGSAVQGSSTVTAGVVGTGAIAWDSPDAKLYLGNGVQVYNAGTTNVANSNMIIGVEAAPHGDSLANYVGVHSKGTDGVQYITVGGKEYVEIDTHNLQSISCDGMYADGTAYMAGAEIDRNKMLLVEKSVWELNTATVAGFSAGGYNTATYSGVLSGNANLVKVGLGTLILDQTNTYTGKTIISQGSLVLKGWAQIGGSADSAALNVTQTAGSTLMLAYDGTYGNEIEGISNDMSIAGTGDVRWMTESATNNATAALISSVSGQTPFTLSGDISGDGNLLHCGSGTLVLSGDSSFTGGTHATRGVVEVQSATGLGAGKVVIDSSADLHVTVEEGTTASRLATTLAADGTTVQGDVVISGTESTERILNVATDGYNNSSTTLHDNGTLLVNGAGVAAATGTLSGTGTVAVSDATGTGAKATVGQMTAYTGDFVVEGNKASITVENGNYSGGSISVSGNDAVLSTKGDITITNGESLSLSSRGNAGSETADSAYVTTTGAVSVASGATLSVSDAATSYEYNLQNLQAAASLNGAAGLKDGSAGEMHAFGANTGADAEDVYSGFFNTSVAMNQKAAGAVDAKGGLTMASGATYETAMANTSLMGGSLTLESGLTLSTTLDLGQGAIDGAGRTTQLVLFSDVNSVNFVLDNLTAVAKSGIYYTKAENYISGSYIDEDTWLVYDSGAGVVYLDGIVPEPTTATLSLLALAALAARRRRR